jgi:hypothetical protein
MGMRHNLSMLTLFGAAILFSIIHEYSLPTACIRPVLARSSASQPLAR